MNLIDGTETWVRGGGRVTQTLMWGFPKKNMSPCDGLKRPRRLRLQSHAKLPAEEGGNGKGSNLEMKTAMRPTHLINWELCRSAPASRERGDLRLLLTCVKARPYLRQKEKKILFCQRQHRREGEPNPSGKTTTERGRNDPARGGAILAC